ncbi:mitochondrial genome maintenance exonuclease 1-like [Malaya genurostris]|uniref:mitochondrial genome maintenance exonuclease 1-like n=1 Tax=Malaya genurostris TaxID=325434 RepID=UPI0026F40983|nr:mitochondrial genome maintenance exonuclease 1-like [Malaya genurostris]
MIKLFNVRQFTTVARSIYNGCKVAKKSKSTTPNGRKARTIKNLNFENKAMFGSVIKKSATVSQDSVEYSERSSEMFWILQNTNAPSTKIRLKGCQTNSTNVLIPFNDVELRSMPSFPLTPSCSGILETHWTRHQFENSPHKSPSVNKVLSATMPESARQALMKWKASKIALLGEEGFSKLQKATLERGNNFHSCLENWFSGKPLDEARLRKANELWLSINPLLNRIVKPARIIEQKIYHPFLHYNGVVDCVSSIDNKIHIIEWKTSENQKNNLSSTFDAPLQLCAYLGALKTDPLYSDLDISNGAVFVAYTNGKPAHLHTINHLKMRKYWSAWLLRLQEYWIRYRDNTLPEPI